jgi:uncharacterized repeat protein (TIGR01451 family)
LDVSQRKRYLVRLVLAAGLLIAPPHGQGRQPPAGDPTSGAGATVAQGRVIATGRAVTSTTETPPAVATPGALHSLVADDGLLPPPGLPSPRGPVQAVSFQTEAPIRPREVPAAPAASGRSPTALQVASLSIEVQVADTMLAGATLPCEIRVSNPGPVPLAGVRVEDQLPAGAKLLSADPVPELQGSRLVWNLGNLEGHGQRRLRLAIQAAGQTELTLAPTATFAAAQALRATVALPAFTVEQAAQGVVQRGSTLSVQIQVTNRGTAPLMHVELRDELPVGLSHPVGRKLVADVGTLAPGETKTLRLDVLATGAGQVVNEVTALADGGRQAQSRMAVQLTETAVAGRVSEGPR